MTPVIEVEPTATRRRIRRLRSYVDKELLQKGEFVCPSYDACSASRGQGHVFREGTMSHVGNNFDLRLDSKPLRIVVVGQESGWPKGDNTEHLARKVTMATRYKQIHDMTGLGRRYYSEIGHPGRNPHMRGTTSALRVAFGLGLGTDYENEFVHPVNGKSFHLFDGFALVNRLLCSAGPQDSSQGHPTRTMWQNCGAHFAATMSILEPTLVIVQGAAVRKWVAQTFVPDVWHEAHLYEAMLGRGRVAVCVFSHPSAHGAVRWGDRPDATYLTDVVAPTLTKARGIA